MAKRAALISTVDFAGEAARISVPTLVMNGDPGLDYVVAGKHDIGLRDADCERAKRHASPRPGTSAA
jgi:hypothetical protein